MLEFHTLVCFVVAKVKNNLEIFKRNTCRFKNSRTFASLLKTSTLEKEVWRDGRVVDCGGLENRCTARYRGFESLSLRNKR